ncbi:UMP kinase [Candidatus Pacearchaeota archaeon]|nr:UMP kinase [Candidatus Pacearchaeota archaeon]
MKEVVVLSLGGSLIIPDKVDVVFLKKFKKFILQNTKTHKFVIVCGGGSLARKYIAALKSAGSSVHLQGLAGIASTRTNARFMSYFFNRDSEKGIPHHVKDIKRLLEKQDFVFCGALTYKTGATTDAQAAEIAASFKAPFINLTNVSGLYNKNPLKHKDAKFIPEITWKEFHKMATKEKFKPGQHFVIDGTASGIILKHKVKTYILGRDLSQLENVLKGKRFRGTLIFG